MDILKAIIKGDKRNHRTWKWIEAMRENKGYPEFSNSFT